MTKYQIRHSLMVEVGDAVARLQRRSNTSYFDCRKLTITKVTDDMIVTNGRTSWLRDSGEQSGQFTPDVGWDAPFIQPWVEEIHAPMLQETELRDLRRYVDWIAPWHLTADQCRRILAIAAEKDAETERQPDPHPDDLAVDRFAAILRAHDQHVQSIARGAKDCWIKGATIELPGSFLDGVVLGWDGGKVVNCPPAFVSDVGHKLAKDCGAYGLMWHTVDGVEARCSLRSDGNYDVSVIAKQFGGGGHKNAAGFSVPLQTLLSWYKRTDYAPA